MPIKEYICTKCLNIFLSKRVKKTCPYCGATWQNEIKAVYDKRIRDKKNKMTALDHLLAEVEKYNHDHGTNLSYGQYVSKTRR